METSNFVCHPMYEIESLDTKFVEEKYACKISCERSNDCRYYYFNTENGCKLYTSCNHISSEQKKGTTYEKQTKGISICEINILLRVCI